MDMILGGLQEFVIDREALRASIHEVETVRHDWATELNWIMNDVELFFFMYLLAICMSSLEKCLLGLLPIFWLS